MTVDKAWIHYHKPENVAQSRFGLWYQRPKKFKTKLYAGKVMVTVFWDAKGVIMLGF